MSGPVRVDYVATPGLEARLRTEARGWTAKLQEVPEFPGIEPGDFKTSAGFPLRFFYKSFLGAMDWRSQELSPPRDQGDSRACTAFAIVGVLEDRIRLASGRTIQLSPWHAHICLGGNRPDVAWDPYYAIPTLTQHRVAQETGVADWSPSACAAAQGAVGLAQVTSVKGDGPARLALKKGPIIAVLELWEDLHRWYSAGLYRHVGGRSYGRHTIQVVGFDADAWIVKNSFGLNWGAGGYGRIAYGQCGLFQYPAYVFTPA